jgi:hypothetical protein
MKRLTLIATLLVAMAWDAHAQASAPASAPASQGGAESACQREAQTTLQGDRPSVVSVSFAAPPSPVPGAADAKDLMLRGTGRARSASGSRVFSYSCTYDLQGRTVTGVVVRDAAGAERKPVQRTVEPDLRAISPAACESSAASALTRRWPAVQGIVFDSDTRQLSQNTAGQSRLQGQGKATLQTGGPSTHFSYDCNLDASSGRVMGVQIKQ